ncbi:hypothetical protein [Nocardioides sp. B-3]|uniref:hypothetical protein n=1 Tax=Nocardioides sp. B-3 TaxID=2895565 RepID=UPI00215240A2|nr:hypothetical protein [Nocardioides sp. B-3]UUZ59084.1 hypothetical protein LP418_24505 [Nocardioides sp. B-3]
MATQLTDDVGLQLLINSTATGAVLVALILALQPVSAAFNPVVTLVELGLGTGRTARRSLPRGRPAGRRDPRRRTREPDVRPRRRHDGHHPA